MKQQRITRHKRVRAKIKGTASRPRLSVFRSNRHVFLQLIDDGSGKTILSVSDRELKSSKKANKSDKAYAAGKLLAEKAGDKKIKNAVFDRGGFKYHGRVRRAAEGAREEGLKF